MINYDPNGVPEVDFETFELAEKQGLKPMLIVCDEPGAKVGDVGGVSFVAFSHFVPRVGERIQLEDGKTCQVTRVYHRVTRDADAKKLLQLVPNVYAKLVS